MSWWVWTIIGIYVVGVIVIFASHLMFLQMVTPGLAFMRAVGWPVWLIIGFPRGVPLTMD